MNERWVDGYNVIHRLPDLAADLEADTEGCRRRFLRRIAPLVFRSKERWTVVFDAPRAGRGRAAGPIDLVYAPDADAWILDRLRQEAQPARITVVSSDEKDIGRAARQLGARVLPAEALVAALEKREAPASDEEEGSEKPENVSAEDVDFWLDQFGGGGSGEPKGDL